MDQKSVELEIFSNNNLMGDDSPHKNTINI
jgi:hypothetical protein